jgi:hypothetical protein
MVLEACWGEIREGFFLEEREGHEERRLFLGMHLEET